MKSACKNGMCEVLHDDNAECEHRIVKTSSVQVCPYMSMADGRCMCKAAHPPKKVITHRRPFEIRNNATFSDHLAERARNERKTKTQRQTTD